MKKLYVYIISLFLIASCIPVPVVVSQEDAGTVASVEHIASAWNDRNRTEITTESYSIVVVDTHSVRIGSRVTLFAFSDGRKCVFVGEIPTTGVPYEECWQVYD